jgi:hypothetical protein
MQATDLFTDCSAEQATEADHTKIYPKYTAQKLKFFNNNNRMVSFKQPINKRVQHRPLPCVQKCAFGELGCFPLAMV